MCVWIEREGEGLLGLAFLPLCAAVTLSVRRGADTVLVVFRVSH